MTKVLVHELPDQTQRLLARLQKVLRDDSRPLAGALLVRAQLEPSEKPRMVVTGQFSSGKSSLIRALTDGAVNPVIDADIATDAVTEYPWDGAVVLVDTPGVQSGLRSHDQLALGAIGRADFVLFVIHVGLFDDACRDYLRRLANELQLFGQMVVVITQIGKQSAPAGVRELAVQEALGTSTFNLPIAEVDSVFYMRSLEGGPRAELLRERSGIDELRATINRISEDRGGLAQLRQPLHLVRQLCDEAQQLFVSDERSRSALAVLAAQRAAISQRRYMIERAFLTAEAGFKSRCLVDVTGFVDTVTTLTAGEAEAAARLDAAKARLVESLNRHAGQFADSINRLAEAQFATLEEQLSEIGESNRVKRLLRPTSDVALETASDIQATAPRDPRRDFAAPAVDWKKVADLMKKGQEWWGAGGGLKDSSGKLGHEIVKKIGHLFDHKFKPWEAIKIADKIGKAVKYGGFAIQIGAAGYEVWKNEREVRKAQIESERQHAAFVTEIMGYADRIAADARNMLWQVIDPPLDAFLAEIQATQEEILGADRARGDAAKELRSIADEADRLLTESA